MHQNNQSLLCQVRMYAIKYNSSEDSHNKAFTGKQEDHLLSVCHPVYKDDNDILPHNMYDIELPKYIWDKYRPKLLRGDDLYVSIPGGRITNGTVVVPMTSQMHVTDTPNRVRRLTGPSTNGTLRTLVLRVSALDTQPGVSTTDLLKYIFHGAVSLKAQLKSCSLEQLMLEPTVYGVLDVHVPVNAVGNSVENLINEGYNTALSMVNNFQDNKEIVIDDIRSLSELIMVILPPGTGSWIGFASVGGQQSVYNDDWGSILGVTAHEVGHNLGLQHAYHNGYEYGDITGYMGNAIRRTNYPQRCYNAQNHWHLGWYTNRSLDIIYPRDSDDPAGLYLVVPFVDYSKAAIHQFVIVRISFEDDASLYMQYNRQKSFNNDTGLFADQLVIVQSTSQGTNLVAGLNMENRFYIQNIHEHQRRKLIIEVCSMQAALSQQEPDIMSVSIGLSVSKCPGSQFPNFSWNTTSNQSNQSVRFGNRAISILVVVFVVAVILMTLVYILLRDDPKKRQKEDRFPVSKGRQETSVMSNDGWSTWSDDWITGEEKRDDPQPG